MNLVKAGGGDEVATTKPARQIARPGPHDLGCSCDVEHSRPANYGGPACDSRRCWCCSIRVCLLVFLSVEVVTNLLEIRVVVSVL